MHVFLQAFANMHSQKYLYLGFASFLKYDFTAFAIMIYGFARFCKVLQMDFRKDSQSAKIIIFHTD